MKPNRKPVEEYAEAIRERFACPVCGSTRLEEDWVLRGGPVALICPCCPYEEVHDSRKKRST